MIPNWQEVNQGLTGALYLARRDPSGLEWFDVSVDGFWKSFFALVLAAPAYALTSVDRWQTDGHLPPLGLLISGELLSYLAGWLVFPIAAIFLTRYMGLAHRYVPLVVTTNWVMLVQTLAFLAAMLVAGLVGGGIASFVLITTTVLLLVYQGYAFMMALESPVGTAIMFVIINALLSAIASRGVASMFFGA